MLLGEVKLVTANYQMLDCSRQLEGVVGFGVAMRHQKKARFTLTLSTSTPKAMANAGV